MARLSSFSGIKIVAITLATLMACSGDETKSATSEGAGGQSGGGGQGGSNLCVTCAQALGQGDEPLQALCAEAKPLYDALHACMCSADTCAMTGCDQWCIGGGGFSACMCQACTTELLDCQEN